MLLLVVSSADDIFRCLHYRPFALVRTRCVKLDIIFLGDKELGLVNVLLGSGFVLRKFRVIYLRYGHACERVVVFVLVPQLEHSAAARIDVDYAESKHFVFFYFYIFASLRGISLVVLFDYEYFV